MQSDKLQALAPKIHCRLQSSLSQSHQQTGCVQTSDVSKTKWHPKRQALSNYWAHDKIKPFLNQLPHLIRLGQGTIDFNKNGFRSNTTALPTPLILLAFTHGANINAVRLQGCQHHRHKSAWIQLIALTVVFDSYFLSTNYQAANGISPNLIFH